MYAVGDYVVHPGQGVCQVSAVAQGSDGWYTLVPISSKHPIQITFPRTQEGRLRTVMSFDEAEELIDKYPLISLDTFHVHNSSLEESHLALPRRFAAAYTTPVRKTSGRPFLMNVFLRWPALVLCMSWQSLCIRRLTR